MSISPSKESHHAPHFHLEPLTIEDGKEICLWLYDPPYDIYNCNAWDAMFEAAEEFSDPVIRKEQYYGVFDSNETLSGFAQLFPLQGTTRLGLGMRPSLCGQGRGVLFVKAIVEEAMKKAPANKIDLEMLTWNLRAYRVYD